MLAKTKVYNPKGWNDIPRNKRARLAYVKANGWIRNLLPDRPGCWAKQKAPTSQYYYVWNPDENELERDYCLSKGPRGRPKTVHVVNDLVCISQPIWERLTRQEKLDWLIKDGFEYNGLTNTWLRPTSRGSRTYYEWNPKREKIHPLHTHDRVVI